MPRRRPSLFTERTLDQLAIDDERSFRHVALYADLKAVLLRDRYVFRVLPRESTGRADRALLLNLTYWGAVGADVLERERLPADVVAHAAWHHLAAGALGIAPGVAPPAEALFVGESISSAFDIYLVGRLLGHAPKSTFLESQVAAMAQSASAAGLSGRGFQSLLEGVVRAPEEAFADLRQLLYDAPMALLGCQGANEALATLLRFDGHRFAPLLHHYEVSNWVLYALAYAAKAGASVATSRARARAFETSLRRRRDPLEWLTNAWVHASVGRKGLTPANGP